MNNYTSNGTMSQSLGVLQGSNSLGVPDVEPWPCTQIVIPFTKTLHCPDPNRPMLKPHYPVGLDGLVEEAHGVGLVEGAFSAQHSVELSIILTEVNFLTMLPAVSLPQRTQGHRDHEGICLLFLLAERTEQDSAGGLEVMWKDEGNHHRQKIYPQVAVTASSRGYWQAGQRLPRRRKLRALRYLP